MGWFYIIYKPLLFDYTQGYLNQNTWSTEAKPQLKKEKLNSSPFNCKVQPELITTLTDLRKNGSLDDIHR